MESSNEEYYEDIALPEADPEPEDGELSYLTVDKEQFLLTLPSPGKVGEIYKIRSPFRKIEVDCGREYPFPMEKGEICTLKAYKNDLPGMRGTLYWRLIGSEMEDR